MGVIFLIWMWAFIFIKHPVLFDWEHKPRYGALYSRYKPDKGTFTYLYYPLFVLRRLIYSILLCIIPNKTAAVLFLLVISIVVWAHVVCYKPCVEKLDNFLYIFNETIFVLLVLL